MEYKEFYKINPGLSKRLMLLEDTGKGVTYGDFTAFYSSVENKLRTGTLLFLFCENSIGAVFFYLACLNKKIVPLLLDAKMEQALAARLIQT